MRESLIILAIIVGVVVKIIDYSFPDYKTMSTSSFPIIVGLMRGASIFILLATTIPLFGMLFNDIIRILFPAIYPVGNLTGLGTVLALICIPSLIGFAFMLMSKGLRKFFPVIMMVIFFLGIISTVSLIKANKKASGHACSFVTVKTI